MVTPEQIVLLQANFDLIAVDAAGFAHRFYSHLFQANPAVERMFQLSMDEQGRKLMDVVNLAVNGLWEPAAIVPVLTALGARHGGYGVKERHYALVGAALLWALERELGAAWTPDVCAAWTAAYAMIAQTMLAGVRKMPKLARRKRTVIDANRPTGKPARPPSDDDHLQPGEHR